MNPDELLAGAVEPSAPRNSRGQYLMAGADGVVAGRTRATTFADAMANTFGLHAWQLRVVAKGMSQRPDLVALAAATPLEDKAAFAPIVAAALELGGGNSAARLGTAFHAFAQRAAEGALSAESVPEDMRGALTAYFAEIRRCGIREDTELMERSVFNATYDLGGTFDRIWTLDAACPLCGRDQVVADIKTGSDLKYAEREIAIQLALYANADAMFERGSAERFEPMPAVCRHVGLIAHVPRGKAECHIERIDLSRGWAAARLAAEVREWQQAKFLRTPYIPSDRAARRDAVQAQPEPLSEERVTALAERGAEMLAGVSLASFADAVTTSNPRSEPESAIRFSNNPVKLSQYSITTPVELGLVEASSAESTADEAVVGSLLPVAEPPIDPDTEAEELARQLKKSKSRLQELARQLMKQPGNNPIKLNQYAIKIAGEIVRHPAWPGFRDDIMTDAGSDVALNRMWGRISAQLDAIEAEDGPELVGPPRLAAPDEKTEHSYWLARVEAAKSKQELASVWREAQDAGFTWTDTLNASALSRLSEM